MELGLQQKHWTKEVVQKTKSREAEKNAPVYKNIISSLKTKCLEANTQITNFMSEIAKGASITSTRTAADRAHELMLDYLNQTTENLKKRSIDKIKLAVAEKDDYIAWIAFE